jgi:iron complex outermembrane recepter protein
MSRKTRRNAFRKAAKVSPGAAKSSTYTKLGLSGFTLGSMAISSTLIAAEPADAPAAPASGPAELQEVVITGIRASLQKSLDIKEQSLGVVDAISAEDIGAFPDASLGEAMQRVPGVTVTRTVQGGMGSGAELFTGNPSSITVRGFGGDFTETLIDGRPQASAAGRTFDFASVGADFVTEVDVHKTPDFNLSSGAVGATVNIKFPKPFDHLGPQARAFGSTTDTTNDGSFRPSFGALFSDTFFNDTLGILVLGDYSDTRVSSHHLDIVGWKGAYLNSCQMAGGPACVDKNGNVIPKNALVLGVDKDHTPVNPNNTFPSWYIQDYALYNDRTDDRRKDGRAVLQWHPTDAVLVTLDDTYSDDHITSMRYQYTTWFNANRLVNVVQDPNGTITNFDYGPAPTDLDSTAQGQYIQNNTLGLNVKWDVNENWTAGLDADQSSSHLNPHGELSGLNVDVGYGPSYNVNSPNFAANQAAGFPNGYVAGINVPGGNDQLPHYTAYGPNNNAANVFGLSPLILGSHVLPITSNRGSDYVNQAKFDVDWHSGDTNVDVGLQFKEDTRNAYALSTFANSAWQLWNGYGPPSGNTQGVTLPASLFANAGAINTSNFFPGFKNNGQLPPIFAYNPYTVYNYLVGLGAGGANPNTISPVPPNCVAGTLGCFSPYTGGPEPFPLDPGSVSFVQEKTYAPFAVLQQKLDIADKPLTVNLGLRYEKTQVQTGGYRRLPTGLQVVNGDQTAFNIFYTPTLFATESHSYRYFLPSLDLNYMLLQDLKVRFDASRTLTRPPLNEITPTLSVGGRVGALSATGNNPGLLPYLSNNFDLGAEWYYGQNEYLAVDGFFKHVSQFPEQQTINVAINNVQDPTTSATAVWAETTFVNSPSANVYGAEIAWQKMLMWGFGYQLNGTIVHTNHPYDRYNLNTQFYLPGLADSANFVGFYQKGGFQARVAVNWTAEQLTATTQEQNGGQFGNEPTFTKAFTEVDFSTQYDFNDHFSVFFKALNLSKSEIVEHGRFSNQILNVQDIGRTFTMGVRAKL